MPPLKSIARLKSLHLTEIWLTIGLFAAVAGLEFATPSNYVFGYLYIGAILIVNARFGRVALLKTTLIGCLLTLLNVWVPNGEVVEPAMVANRLIVILALLVTGFLSDRNHLYQEKLLQQQAKLQTQEKIASVREDFASTLTHDLKTPLLGAIETLNALQREDFGRVLPIQKTVLATMTRSHQTSLQLVETLVDIYQNDIEGLTLQLAPVDLVKIAEDVVSTLMTLASSRRVHISFSYGTSDFRKFLWVNGDAFQLQRVFVNLLTNAINHSPRGGKIEVVLDAGSSHQTVKIIDIGAGITPEELPYLFERFYQGCSDRQARGSGLGLYLTRQIIDAHGGTIWAENYFPHGALFAFRLPVLPFQPSLLN